MKERVNPDLIFASSNISNIWEKFVLDTTPPNLCQFKPSNCCTTYHIQDTLQPEESGQKDFQRTLIIILKKLMTSQKTMNGSRNVTYGIEKTHTRGCRSNYIPGLTDESKSLYEAYKKQYSIDPYGEITIDTGNTLIDKMKDEKKKSWEEVITSTDLTHNSRRAWPTIRKLSNDPTTPNAP